VHKICPTFSYQISHPLSPLSYSNRSQNINAEDLTEVHTNFYDIMVRNAFGNYRDILREASYNALMAEHLTYEGSKSTSFVYEDDDKRNSNADENYAR